MSFLHNILARIQTKTDEIKEKKQFLDLVEEQSKPIRRQAYLDERKKSAISEGIALAKIDGQKKVPQNKKSETDFGIGRGLEDPYKYLRDKSKLNKEKSK